jgi:WD40 repeat protein
MKVEEENYHVGGTLPPNSPTYINRQADIELCNSLRYGEFCYVLNSRQMGKSSLQLKAMEKLQAEGFSCVTIDLSTIGDKDITIDRWYEGIIYTIVTYLSLLSPKELKNWRSEHQFLPPVQRLSVFIEKVLLAKNNNKIIIFIDEIDSILSLPFSTDELFTLIRACYNNRASVSEYQRLTFAILGVATPSDLVRDRNITPFNIGRSISLQGFQFHEALTLASGLETIAKNPTKVLEEILFWTGGQPFLTQKICKLLSRYVDKINSGDEKETVSQIVNNYIIHNWENQDEPQHLKTIRERVLKNEKRTSRLLGLYQKILDSPNLEIESSPDTGEELELQIAGLIVKQKNILKIYNPIYAAVFNREWVDKIFCNLRPYSASITAWIDSEFTDESRLLRGESLQDALNWSADKSLCDIDYQFLQASQELSEKEVQKQLKKAKWTLAILSTLTLSLAIALGVIAGQYQALKEANATIKIDRQGNEALRQFDGGTKEIKALQSAIAAGENLKQLVKNRNSPADYPTVSPLLALQTILDNINDKGVLPAYKNRIEVVVANQDREILTIGDNGIVKVWGKKKSAVISPELSGAVSVNFSSDGQTIAKVTKNSQIELWNKSKKLLRIINRDRSSIASITFSPQNSYLAFANSEGLVTIANSQGEKLVAWQTDKAIGLNFSADEKYLTTVSELGKVTVWTLQGQKLSSFSTKINREPIYNVINFHPNREQLAIATGEGIVSIWENFSGQLISKFDTKQNQVYSLSYTPDGKYLATAGADSTVKLWTLTGKQLDAITARGKEINSFTFVSKNRDRGYEIALAVGNGKLQKGILKHHHFSQLFKGEEKLPQSLNSIVATTSGKEIARYHNNTIEIFEERGEKLLGTILVLPGEIVNLSFSPQGDKLVTAKLDGTVQLWDKFGKTLGKTFRTEQKTITNINFTPDGNAIVTVGEDGTMKFWTLWGNLKSPTLQVHDGGVKLLNFSANGERIATLGEDSRIRIWNRVGEKLAEFETPPTGVMQMALNGDGKLLAIATEDGKANILVLEGQAKGQYLAQLQIYEPNTNIVHLSFLQEDTFNTISADGTVRFWEIQTLDRLLARSKNWY